ncbi:hypothetical protein FO519_005764 [Halicephalobus sp. NKZ332]|nr:hypothetical protein FO519_005764 [Halicephalobus sp. NKZ332]
MKFFPIFLVGFFVTIEATVDSIDFEILLRALELPRAVRNCVDPMINILQISFTKGDPVGDLGEICKSYNKTTECMQKTNTASTGKVFRIASSGIGNLCTIKWPFLEKNMDCLKIHAGYKSRACDAKCGMTKALSDLSHDGEVILLAKTGGNMVKMLTKLGNVCSGARCYLPCFRNQLNMSCTRAGGMIVDALLKPFHFLAAFVKDSGPLVHGFLKNNLPPTCSFLTNQTALIDIRKGEIS